MVAGRRLDAGLHLLDRQLIDRDGRLVGKIDDLELTEREDGAPTVTAILAGPGALAGRLGGRLGRWLEDVSNRLREGDENRPARIPFGLVADIDSAVRLAADKHELETDRVEGWVRQRLIGRIPGAGDAPE
jgi:sporulation protein YlmC with PRC-barrel domain